MKKIFVFVFSVALLGIAGCKTTEANYRAAYEIAKEKQMDSGDSITNAGLKSQQMPRQMVFGADTLQVRTEAVGVTANGGGTNDMLKKYCVVAGQFHQIFNASSMRSRLVADGYEGTFLLHNRMKQYYVVVGSYNLPSEARAMIDSLKADESLVFKAPFPYVLRPAHLVR